MTPDIIRHGEKIDRPGLYRMPINWYHDDCTVGPSISSTGIRTLLDCPAKYWATSYLNPDRAPTQSNAVFDFGKCAHSVILEGRLPRREFAVSPYADFRTKAAQAWKEKAERIGLAIIKPDDLRTIAGMYQQIMRHPIVEAGGLDGMVEMSLIWKDEATGVWCKTRPDSIPLGNMIVDYKTVADASLRAVAQSVEKYRYDIQIAMAIAGMKAVLGQSVESAGLLCQEKVHPFVVSFYEIADSYLAAGMQMFRQGLETFRGCLDANDWPGFFEDNSTIVPRDFILRRAFGGESADIGVLDYG